ncbi:TolC family outer membrane protein [Pseudosulfitobacter koreensis]|uniref:TolC family outer membrane protein n=1 Tax=Pseudosulfitobacter koreensis TaxID=2968472 RepID=A0ABT1Z4P3_9RHOB|nr:TolC family outer membrane protein [Pseudosulfitobacter koreense]MCR8828104.1 TolC family outer membrane protein [Pseudosulfitobacter koreense]
MRSPARRFTAKTLGAALAIGVVFAAPLRADTLADALAGAYTHSGLLDQNRALLRAADEDVAAAQALLRPIVNWSASIDHSFSESGATTTGLTGVSSFNRTSLSGTSTTVGIVAQMLLYDFGASQSRIAAAKETVLATRASLTSIEQQVLLRAVSAYMNVRQAYEFVALRENNLRLLTQELRAAQDRFEVGEVTRTDVSLAEAQLAAARSGVAAARRDLAQAIEFYRNVVGRRPGQLAPPPSLPRTETNVDTAKAVAMRRHPDIDAAQHQVAATDLLVIATDRDMYPQLSLNGSLSATENFGNDNFRRGGAVGLEFGGPIYQGGRLSSANRAAMARRDAARANLHVVRHNLAENVGNAIADLQALIAQSQASERQVSAANVAFSGVREEATLGARTTLDVLDAEQTLLDAQALRIQAQSQVYVAAYAVLASMGLLTAEQLGLNVQIYDPEAYYNLVKDGPAKLTKQGKQLDRVLEALGKE